jgi:L-iditol 2-dehydrogenase
LKAAFLTGLRRLEIREVPQPQIRDDSEVLLRVDVVGVCGSDVHVYREGQIGGLAAQFPWIVGHECAGTVAATGKSVRRLRKGTRVAVDPLISCGQCDQCRIGRRHTCRNQLFLATPGQAPGAMAEYLVIPACCCYPIPDSITFVQAALAEPLSIALHARNLANMKPRQSAAVLGCGPIGLSVLAALRHAGAGRVYATDLIDRRLEMARQFGADWIGSPKRQDIVAEISRAEPTGVDYVFECAGQQETIDQGVRILRPGGTLLLVGIPEEDRISIEIHPARRHELTLQNVRRQNDCVREAIDMVADGKVDLDAMATHHFNLGDSQAAFETVCERRDGVIKAIIHIAE